ncbi:MAG: VanZ family protein [Verrucomicrobiales bacterium]
MKTSRWWLVAFAAMAAFLGVIIYLADTGRPELWNFPQAIPYGDKWGHFVLFGTLTFLACMAWPRSHLKSGHFFLSLPVLLILAFAVGEEISQGWIPGRTLDGMDLAAGCVGIFLASGFAGFLMKRARSKVSEVA